MESGNITTAEGFRSAYAEVFTDVVRAGRRPRRSSEALASTGCPGWTVRDHVAHIVDLESLLIGRPRADHAVPEGLPYIRNEPGEFMEIGVDARRGVPFARPHRGVPGRDQGAARRGSRTLEDSQLDEMGQGFFGQSKVRSLLAIRVFDLWAHEQDIRRALGNPGGFDGIAAAHSRERMLMGAGNKHPGAARPGRRDRRRLRHHRPRWRAAGDHVRRRARTGRHGRPRRCRRRHLRLDLQHADGARLRPLRRPLAHARALLSKVTRTWGGACSRTWRSRRDTRPSLAGASSQRRSGDARSPVAGCSRICPTCRTSAPAPTGPATPITAPTLSGAQFDWSSTHGHVVVLDFWGSWCGPCRARAAGAQHAGHAQWRSERRDLPRAWTCEDNDVDGVAYERIFNVAYPSVNDASEVITSEYNVHRSADGGRRRRQGQHRRSIPRHTHRA